MHNAVTLQYGKLIHNNILLAFELITPAHKRLAELADVCGIVGREGNAFIRWIEETNAKMGLPDKFDVVKDENIDQMITWAKKKSNPLYPVPTVWSQKGFRHLIQSVRR